MGLITDSSNLCVGSRWRPDATPLVRATGARFQTKRKRVVGFLTIFARQPEWRCVELMMAEPVFLRRSWGWSIRARGPRATIAAAGALAGSHSHCTIFWLWVEKLGSGRNGRASTGGYIRGAPEGYPMFYPSPDFVSVTSMFPASYVFVCSVLKIKVPSRPYPSLN